LLHVVLCLLFSCAILSWFINLALCDLFATSFPLNTSLIYIHLFFLWIFFTLSGMVSSIIIMVCQILWNHLYSLDILLRVFSGKGSLWILDPNEILIHLRNIAYNLKSINFNVYKHVQSRQTTIWNDFTVFLLWKCWVINRGVF